VLGAELDAAALEILDQLAQVRQRRQHHDLDAGHRQARGHAAEQLRGEGTAAVQLPVTGYDPAAHRGTPVERHARIADGAPKAARDTRNPLVGAAEAATFAYSSRSGEKLAASAAPAGIPGFAGLPGFRALLQLDFPQPLLEVALRRDRL